MRLFGAAAEILLTNSHASQNHKIFELEVWLGMPETSPLYREGPEAPHRLNVGLQGHLFFGPRKADFFRGAINEAGIWSLVCVFLYLLSLTDRNDKDNG